MFPLRNNVGIHFVFLALQVNVLAYFETLCTDTGAANVLINSSLTVLIVRMLRNARAPTLRVRLASALGLLVRHATYIADELATTGDAFASTACLLVQTLLPFFAVGCMSIYLGGCLSLCLCVFHLSACMSVCLSVLTFVCAYQSVCLQV